MGPLTRKITVLTSIAALSLGGATVAQAKHGADDPVKEVRGGKRADDTQPHARRSADDRKLASCLKRARRSDDRTERKAKVARCKKAASRRADDRAGDNGARTPTAGSPAADDHGGDRPAGTTDDPAGDDKGGQRPAGTSDDPAGDDKGGQRPAGVSDDPAGDDHGSGGHGADDPAGHR
jgi:hypothetical protein